MSDGRIEDMAAFVASLRTASKEYENDPADDAFGRIIETRMLIAARTIEVLLSQLETAKGAKCFECSSPLNGSYCPRCNPLPDIQSARDAERERCAKAIPAAMQSAWDEICSDTGYHPLDITHEGKKLFFNPAHWAALTEAIIRARPDPEGEGR